MSCTHIPGLDGRQRLRRMIHFNLSQRGRDRVGPAATLEKEMRLAGLGQGNRRVTRASARCARMQGWLGCLLPTTEFLPPVSSSPERSIHTVNHSIQKARTPPPFLTTLSILLCTCHHGRRSNYNQWQNQPQARRICLPGAEPQGPARERVQRAGKGVVIAED